MKIGGIDPRTLPTEETLVLPRGDQILVFKATGLPDMAKFDRMCPEPTPPTKLVRGGPVQDWMNPDYMTAVLEQNKRRVGYTVINSLRPSMIEWDTVNDDDPSTWDKWDKDLKNSGLTQIECNRVLGLVWEANALDENKLQKARELFLQGTMQK